jgi:hypothetical protein
MIRQRADMGNRVLSGEILLEAVVVDSLVMRLATSGHLGAVCGGHALDLPGQGPARIDSICNISDQACRPFPQPRAPNSSRLGKINP